MAFERFNEVKYQILATIVGNIIVFAHGCNIGWFSPSLLVLVSEDSPLASGPLTFDQVGWIASVPSLGAIIGPLIYGLIANRIGYRNALLLTSIPISISWLLIIFAQNGWYIGAARILIGVSGGATYLCIPGFVAEIADDHIRGQLNSYIQVCFYSGILFGYIGGAYIDFGTNPIVMAVIPYLFVAIFMFMPSSPQHLLKSEKIEEAEQSLRFYRNVKNANKEKKDKVEAEFDKFKAIAKNNEASSDLSIADFFTPAARRAFTIAPILMFVSQLSGSYTISNYAATIFNETGSSIDANVSSIVMGILQVCGNYTASQLIDRTGRKTLLLISTTGAAISQAITGTYIYLGKSGYDVSAFNLLPVMSISFFIFINAIGILSVPYVILAEVMPQKIRKVGSTICTMGSFIMQFGVLSLFPIMLTSIELYGCIWFFSSMATFGLLFTIFVVKETKGKNLDVLDENKMNS